MRLETDDLILKAGSFNDWEALYENLWRHNESFLFLFSRPSESEEAAQKRTAAYAQMQQEIDTEFFVYERATNQAIGIAGIKCLKPGIWTVTDIAVGPAFCGRGYGKQILEVLVDLAFDERNAEELHYECFSENERSTYLARSCGFVYTHSEQAELRKDGNPVILRQYLLTKAGREKP